MKDYLVLLTSDDDTNNNDNRRNYDSSSNTGIEELLSWTREHIALLSTTTTTILVKSQFVASRLLQDVEALNEEKKRKDDNRDDKTKMPSFQWKLDVEVLLEEDDGNDDDNNKTDNLHPANENIWDLILVSKILSLSHAASANSVVGIFYFPDQHASHHLQLAQTTALNNIMRICQHTKPTIPLALNRATASLCVKTLFYTRIAYVIFNPAAGQRPAEEDMATLKRELEPFMRLKIFYTEKDRSIAEQALEIVDLIKKEQTQQVVQVTVSTTATDSIATETHSPDDDKFIIIASGGDGTVSAIAGATLNSGIPVGIIPRGTANAFSVALGIPTNSVEEACQLIVQRTVREVDGALLSAELLWHSSISGDEDDQGLPDLGIDNAGCSETEKQNHDNGDMKHDHGNTSHIHHIPKSSRWINHAGLGFEAGLVDNATRELKDKFGNLAYTIGAAQQILRNEQFRCTFVVDGDDSTEKTVETNIITIANVDPPSSIFAQGFGKVLPDDGLFEVTIGTSTGLEGGIQSLAALVANTIVKDNVGSDKLLCFRCREIRVTCDPPQKLLMDGEVIRDMDTVTFTCVANGLKLRVYSFVIVENVSVEELLSSIATPEQFVAVIRGDFCTAVSLLRRSLENDELYLTIASRIKEILPLDENTFNIVVNVLVQATAQNKADYHKIGLTDHEKEKTKKAEYKAEEPRAVPSMDREKKIRKQIEIQQNMRQLKTTEKTKQMPLDIEMIKSKIKAKEMGIFDEIFGGEQRCHLVDEPKKEAVNIAGDGYSYEGWQSPTAKKPSVSFSSPNRADRRELSSPSTQRNSKRVCFEAAPTQIEHDVPAAKQEGSSTNLASTRRSSKNGVQWKTVGRFGTKGYLFPRTEDADACMK